MTGSEIQCWFDLDTKNSVHYPLSQTDLLNWADEVSKRASARVFWISAFRPALSLSSCASDIPDARTPFCSLTGSATSGSARSAWS